MDGLKHEYLQSQLGRVRCILDIAFGGAGCIELVGLWSLEVCHPNTKTFPAYICIISHANKVIRVFYPHLRSWRPIRVA
jgi:hypothetical protein